MKYLLQICILLLLFTSCRTKKIAFDANVIAEKMSAKKVARKHVAASFDKKTIAAKLKVNFDNGEKRQSVSVTLRIIKDEVIWIKVTKLITVLKVKITPTSVQYYSPYLKNYYEGDFSGLEKLLGVAINFKQLQNVLLGQAIQNVKKQKHHIEIRDNAFLLSPKAQSDLFDIFYVVNPSHFKLERQSIVNPIKKQRLDILYQNYKVIKEAIFPTKISIKTKQEKEYMNIVATFKTIKFNSSIRTSFKIPNNYKRINL
jgi:hypothetical protein